MNDKEETDFIRSVANKEWECHRLDKERSKLYSENIKLIKKFPVPNNELLSALIKRKEEFSNLHFAPLHVK